MPQECVPRAIEPQLRGVLGSVLHSLDKRVLSPSEWWTWNKKGNIWKRKIEQHASPFAEQKNDEVRMLSHVQRTSNSLVPFCNTVRRGAWHQHEWMCHAMREANQWRITN